MQGNEFNELRSDRTQIKTVYLRCKPKCFGFMIKCFGASNIDDTKMFTIFNDAVIVLYEKIDDSNFKLTSSIQTYLNSVCRNIALNEFKKEKRLYKTTDQDIENMDYVNKITDVLEEPTADNPYEVAIQKAFTIMKEQGGNCPEILAMFWYQKASMEDIALKFSYSNPANAKNQKARCQKRLKEIALQLVQL